MGHEQSQHQVSQSAKRRGAPAWQNSSIRAKQQSEAHSYGRAHCDLGEIQISLSYQPAINRLTIDLHRARGLKSEDLIGNSDPYVKVWLLYDGKKVEKKKTIVIENTLNPFFDERFMFIITNEKIRKAALHISVWDYDRVGRNDFLGEVIIGGIGSSGALEQTHWREMLAQNGEAATRWHPLKSCVNG